MAGQASRLYGTGHKALLLFVSCALAVAFVVCSHAASETAVQGSDRTGGKRHIIVAFDVSKSMAPGKKQKGKSRDKDYVDRVHQYILQVLYEKPPKVVVSPDKTLPEVLENSDLDFSAPLYRPGDSFTMFEFAAKTEYVYSRREQFISRETLSSVLPRSFPGEWSLVKCSRAEAYENHDPRDKETLFILVSDEEEDINIQDKEKYRECDARYTVYESDHGSRAKYALLVGDKVWIKIYRIEGAVGPYPFFLVGHRDGDKRVDSVEFKPSAQDGKVISERGYGVILNPRMKRAYVIRKVKAIVRETGTDRAVVEQVVHDGQTEPPLKLADLSLHKDYLSDRYRLEFDIDYVPVAVSGDKRKPKQEQFVIRNIALAGEGTPPPPPPPPAPADPFSLSSRTTTLTLKGSNYEARDLSLTLDKAVQADKITVEHIRWKDDDRFSVDVSFRDGESFPMALGFSLPAEKGMAGKPIAGRLEVRYSVQDTGTRTQALRLTVEPQPCKPASFGLICADATRGNEALFVPAPDEEKLVLKGCKLTPNTKTPLKDMEIKDAKLLLGNVVCPLGPLNLVDLNFDLKAELDKKEWGRLWKEKPERGRVEILYSSAECPDPQRVTVLVTLNRIPPPPPLRDPFILTAKPTETAPAKSVNAKWTDNGLRLDDCYIRPREGLPAQDLSGFRDVSIKLSGLCKRDSKATAFPHKLDVVLKPEETAGLTPGTRELDVAVSYVSSETGKEVSQPLKLTVNVPKVEPPQFMVVGKPADTAPLAERELKKDAAGLLLSDLFLKITKSNNTERIEKIQFLVDNSVLKEWQNINLKQFPYPLNATIPAYKLKTGKSTVRVAFAQTGLAKSGSVDVPGPKLSTAFPWLLAIAGITGLLVLAGVVVALFICLGIRKKPIKFKVVLVGEG
ncbi:MAG: hypothetical protein V2B18_08010, partial [Pseudomonadota bacterium]